MDRLLGRKPAAKKSAAKQKTQKSGIATLPAGATWDLLVPDPEPVPEPVNPDATLRPPTEREGDLSRKYRYNDRFERAPFTGTDAKLVQPASKAAPVSARKKNKGSFSPPDKNKPKRIPQPRVKGGPSTKHLQRYKLDTHLEPLNWFRSFMPLFPEDNLEPLDEIDAIGDGETPFCVANWTKYTNTKAVFMGAGDECG